MAVPEAEGGHLKKKKNEFQNGCLILVAQYPREAVW